MALIKADRVRESSTTTGTGAFTLSGAEATFRAFSAVCATGDTVYYTIAHRTANEWETGLGTYSSANTLTRTTVHASSNSGSAVNFSAGTKEVFLSLTASQLNGILDTSGITGTLAVANGGTGATTSTAAAVNLVNSAPNDGQEYTLKSKKTSGAVSYYWVDSTGYAPTVDLLFAANKSLTPYAGPTPSFSRASTGTYFNSSGVLTSAAINAPRFNHVYNGANWVSKGLLVEEQRTNLCPYSEDLTNASWTKSGATISSNAIAAPDANTTADKIVETATSAYHNIIRFDSGIASGTYTLSAFCKYAGRKYLVVRINDYATDANAASVVVDLETGNISGAATAYGTFSAASATVTDVSNGWFRIALKAVVSSTGVGLKLMLSNDGTRTANGLANSYTGDGTSGAYVWGAQYELGAFATSYIKTTTSTTRSADVCQITGSDFSGFWNGTEGAVVVEYDRLAPIGTATPGYTYPRTFSFAGTSGNNIALFGRHDSSPPQELVSASASSVQQFAFSPSTTDNTALGVQKIALAFKTDDSALSYKGAAVLTDNSCTVPVITSLSIGSLSGSSNYLSGHIARLRYYPVRLPNATLQTLST